MSNVNVNSSFVSLLEEVALLNTNSIEIIAKFNQALNTNASVVNINMLNPDGTTTVYQMPTIGYLKQQIDTANTNIKRLAGIDSNTFIQDGKIVKKVYTVDVNREPYPINAVGAVSQFTQNSNWFFESLMNPLLSVKIDLSNALPTGVNKVLSRRYIIKFEQNQDGLTTAGQKSQSDFVTKFLNRTDITVGELENWIGNPTNIGVISNTYIPYMIDEQVFDLSIKELNFKGTFSVLQIENDAINSKVWYHLNTLNYYGKDGSINTLATGDNLIINRQGSSSIYRIKEISTAAQLFRINVERIEGYDPIPIGANILEYYSTLSQNNSVKISIGFNEYNVVFVKPVNDLNDIISSVWSSGSAFFTGDLILDSDTSTNLVDFYYKYVSDFGAILKDFVTQKLPTSIGITPNKPTLDTNNFKVVQINQHLTDTTDSVEIKKLHAQKSNVKSKIDQTNNAILEKNKEFNTKNFKGVAEKNKAQNELDSLVRTQESQTRMYSSIVGQIATTKTTVKESPKFRVRGFWEFPSPQIKVGYRPQEVIGFYIEYRYSNKAGKQPNTEGFKLTQTEGSFDGAVDSTGLPTVAPSNTSQRTAPTSQGTTATQSTTTPKTAYFSQWIPLYTDIRKRAKDDVTGLWYWKIEDVSDADTPNINQLDIAIQQNEKVEIRIKSISEVGYPDSKMFSDFSDILTVEFPDELNNVLDDNQFILKEATQEEALLKFENNLASKGLNDHLKDQFYIGTNTYVAHNLSNIVTTTKDLQGNAVMAQTVIDTLTNEIAQLKEAIKTPKGQIQVSLFRNTSETVLKNNSDVTFNVECEDYGHTTGSTSRNYINDVYIIKDFYLRIKNTSAYNSLGLLSDRTYDITNTTNTFYKNSDNRAVFVDTDDSIYTQSDYQFVWFSDNVGSNAGSEIYYSLTGATQAQPTKNPYETILNSGRNFGASVNLGGSNTMVNTILTGYTLSPAPTGQFVATVHPVVPKYTDIIETGENSTKFIEPNEYFDIPINIYFMFKYSGSSSYQISPTKSLVSLTKKVRIFLDIDGQTRPYQTTLTFNIRQNKTSITATDKVYINTNPDSTI